MQTRTIAPSREKSIRKRTARLALKDARIEASLLHLGLIPAVEREGFWASCWAGYVAWDWAGARVWLDKPERRAMRRLLMENTWPGLIDLEKQLAREELDRRLRREERRYRRGWR